MQVRRFPQANSRYIITADFQRLIMKWLADITHELFFVNPARGILKWGYIHGLYAHDEYDRSNVHNCALTNEEKRLLALRCAQRTGSTSDKVTA